MPDTEIFEEYTSLGEILPDKKYRYTQSSLKVLPSWCRQAVEVFLEQKRREFREETTIRKFQYSCIRFCHFLVSHGYENFARLSSGVVKEFGHQDKHDTFRGRSTCYTIVRGVWSSFFVTLVARKYLLLPEFIPPVMLRFLPAKGYDIR